MDTSDQPDVWTRLLGLARAVDGRSYYQLLGVTMDAAGEELRQQYATRKALIEAFPRSNGAAAPAQREALAVLKTRLREALDVLVDPVLRRRYDERLAEGELRLPEVEARPRAESVRGDTRAPFTAMVRVSCPSWSEFLTLHANNISRGGLFVKTATPLQRGTAVKLRIVLPQQYTLELEAEVVRSVHTPAPGMGLAFRPMDDFRKSIVERLVREARELDSSIDIDVDDDDVVYVDDVPSAIEDETQTSKYERGASAPGSSLRLEDLFSRPVAINEPGEIERLSHDELCAEARELLSQKRYADARDKFAQAMRSSPRDLSLRAGFHLAAAYEAKEDGRSDEAHEHFERVLIFDKNCRAAIRELRS